MPQLENFLNEPTVKKLFLQYMNRDDQTCSSVMEPSNESGNNESK